MKKTFMKPLYMRQERRAWNNLEEETNLYVVSKKTLDLINLITLQMSHIMMLFHN
jgi:hypothetical protein